ncbi:MAG: RNase H family protein [Intestinimonas sp.]
MKRRTICLTGPARQSRSRGWGAILTYGSFKKELSGGEAHTTNNRMELTGVIAALEALREPCIVELWSDSNMSSTPWKGWAKALAGQGLGQGGQKARP